MSSNGKVSSNDASSKKRREKSSEANKAAAQSKVLKKEPANGIGAKTDKAQRSSTKANGQSAGTSPERIPKKPAPLKGTSTPQRTLANKHASAPESSTASKPPVQRAGPGNTLSTKPKSGTPDVLNRTAKSSNKAPGSGKVAAKAVQAKHITPSKARGNADPSSTALQSAQSPGDTGSATATANGRRMSKDEFTPVIEYVKPPNQLQLSASELSEEFARSLNTAKAGPARTIVRYNLEERVFKAEPQLEQVSLHYSAEGHLVLRESEEGQRILKLHATANEAEARMKEQEEAKEPGTGQGDAVGPKRLRNQFNFSERGAQTAYFPPKDRGINTDPPETDETCGSCSQWEIYDAYMADQRLQRQQEDAQRQKAASKADRCSDQQSPLREQDREGNVLGSQQTQAALKMVERMGVQNQSTDIIQDFKYWDDEADAIRTDEGTLLPLWKFDCSLTRQKQVTSVNWSATYSDFLIATFGSFDFQKQTSGLVLGFSLKNPSHPEFLFHMRSGALSAQTHPQHPHLLAVACQDGSVQVFDVRKQSAQAPAHSSSPTTGQHTRPAWAVAWQPEQHGSPLAFHSLSSDGRLLLWTLATAELSLRVWGPSPQESFRLMQAMPKGLHPEEEASRPVLAPGCCMDFHPEHDFLFIVGTEEGAIYKCSTAHRQGYLMTYQGHDMSVYAVHWCSMQPDVFLSASADWTVKLWHSNEDKALMSFSLGSSVGDVAWSPLSATIFAAVTDDGLARVFDLAQNDSEPLCEQKLAAKVGLSRLAVSAKLDVMLVGDDRGQLAVLKLSPNLRKYAKGDTAAGRKAAEQQRLEAVLAVARKRAQALAEP